MKTNEKSTAQGVKSSAWLDDYYPGKGCQCFAKNESECGCENINWTPKKYYTWDGIMKLASRSGFIAQSYGGLAILMCHEEQIKQGIFDKIQKMCKQ